MIPGLQYVDDIPEKGLFVGASLNITCLPRYTFTNNDTTRKVHCNLKMEYENGTKVADWDLERNDVCKRM